jgi:T-complex protein 1 subunit delta
VVLAGALLKQCQTLLGKGVHPTVISEALHKASEKAVEVYSLLCRPPLVDAYSGSCSIFKSDVSFVLLEQVLTAMAVPVELSDRESLIKSASTSLNSKVCGNFWPSMVLRICRFQSLEA